GALGTDTGGSVRLPAAMCGVIGLKGTLTRTSRHGLLPQSHSMELPGPLARTARDCARMMSVIAGHDPSDAKTSHRRVPDYESTLERPVRGMRIGVPRAELRAATSTEVDALLDASLAVYGELGAEIVEVELAGLDAMVNRWKVIMAVESAAVHGNSIRAHPQAYAEQVRQRIETGFHVPGSRYVEALHCRGHDLARVMHEVFSRV
ncbi:MAG: amidase, partial [Gammaproteobacteria bacterium]|nr:amidase [Gammaproteobacteria bacterium]